MPAPSGDTAAGAKSPGIGSAAPAPADWQALSVSNLPLATSLLQVHASNTHGPRRGSISRDVC